MRGYSRVFGGVAALALLVAACSSGGTTTTGGGNKKGAGKLMCFVTDTAGINDKSFNQTGYKGLTDGAKELGYQTKYLQSHTQDDYAPNIQAFIDQKCDLIVTSGFLLGPATAEAAQKNPSQKFGIIDYDYFDTAGNHITYPNVRALTFQTDQNSFLAGYLAAGLTKVTGPGAVIEIADSKRPVPAGDNPANYIVLVDDLHDIVTALWASGAEAITINGERLVSTSSIYGVGSSILVNTAFLSPTFRIEAIGPQDLLDRFLANKML